MSRGVKKDMTKKKVENYDKLVTSIIILIVHKKNHKTVCINIRMGKQNKYLRVYMFFIEK